jgi:hypothetical protein
MKHAGPDTLAILAPLLARIRALPGLVERTPGCFYRGSTAFLHFHVDPSLHGAARRRDADAAAAAARVVEGVGVERRRVLHFLFGPPRLPHGLAWAHAR